MSETPPRKQTRNKTFRLDELTCEILEREAIDRNVSVNEMINELILKEFSQGTIFKSRKIIRVNLLTLQLITEALPDEKIIEIGEKIASDALLKDLPLEIAGDASLKAIQKTMKFLAGHWDFEYSEVEHAGKKVIILAHYVGAVIHCSSEPIGRRFFSQRAPRSTFLLTTMPSFSDLSN